MMIDTHVHIWDLATNPFGVEYPWLTADLAPLFRTYTLAEIVPEMQVGGVSGVVLVQASDSTAETDALLAAAQAASDELAVHVVGWFPLPDASACESEWARLAGRPDLVGVRHLIHDEPDREWMLRPDVAAGMRVLERHGLSFDAVAERPDLLAQVPVVARRHPEMSVVLDHLGKPPIAAGSAAERADWARLIRACAAEPGVVAKVSELNTASSPGWTAQDWQPYVDIALEAFGPDRLMIGSDWPVALLRAGSYGEVLAALQRVLEGLTVQERHQVLQGTAQRVYRFS
jgi:L-fuconolactonase